MEHQTIWANKITGYATVAVDSLLANERNFRLHSRAQQEALAAVLGDIGIVQNLLVNQRTSPDWPDGDRHVETLIDGACRVMLALRHGQSTLPVTYVDLSPQEEYIALASLDPLGAMAGMDHQLYLALTQDIVPTSDGLAAFLTSMVDDHPTEAPRMPQEPRGAQEVCCPSCGTCFVPERDTGGMNGA